MHIRSPFPPEIVDAVIDELHDDFTALKRCSLVSNEFRPRSQMHLYSRITIEFTGPIHHRHPARPFVTVLTPRLGHCVRHLTLVNNVQQWWDHYNDDYFKNEDYIMPLLFKQLHHLHSFRLISAGKIMDFGPRHLSPSLQSAVVAMIQKTRVAELTVQDFVDFPMVSLALTCPHLKELSFRRDDGNVTVAEEILLVPPGIEIEDKAHLDALELDDRAVTSIDILYRMTKLPQARLTLSHLRDLSIIGYEPSIMACVSKIVLMPPARLNV
ncbi:hypothetical protein Hypma_005150 [Hypsizygus marmoreus]|uniref:F-box domain-containing protein n=1 Tax=Hypsizygus marmoreus TaxID=39966 RepID=A0A369JXI2_HYPMA|nr:hypothetical protein Hypma_005150 [Hypsizygus marmoreus]